MTYRIYWLALAGLALVAFAPTLYESAFSDDDLEKALMTPPTRIERNVAPSGSSRGEITQIPPYETRTPTQFVAAPETSENEQGQIVVRNAKVETPVGEGYDVVVSANGQGLLSELGLCELNAKGEVVLGEDGTSKRSPLRRGMVVHKGDVLGKQQDDELVQDRIVAQQELLVAEKEAEKTLEIEVARAAASVAQASYKRAESLNRDMPGAVSQEEVQEKYYDWVRAAKSVDKAEYDLEINQEKVKVARARVNAAEVQIRNRKFFCPIDGVIDDVYQNEGQWLREGDKILRIHRLDKVLVTGAINASQYAPEAIDGKVIDVTIKRPGMEDQTLTGKVFYVRQIVESGHYYFYADVENKRTESGYWLLNPGSLVTVTVR